MLLDMTPILLLNFHQQLFSMEEVWKEIPGTNAGYSVSNLGRVKRNATVVERHFTDGRKVKQPLKESLLKPSCTNRGGYPSITLRINKTNKREYVHRLVAQAFLPPPSSKRHYQVCHNDGNAGNARSDNLRWDTAVGNGADRLKHGTGAKGVNNPRSKYSEEKIRQVKKALETNNARQVAEMFDMPWSTVRSIKQGRRW